MLSARSAVVSAISSAVVIAGLAFTPPAMAEISTLSCGPPVTGMYHCGPLSKGSSRATGLITYKTTGVLAIKSGPSYTMTVSAYESRGGTNVKIWEGSSNSGTLTKTLTKKVTGHTNCSNTGSMKNDVRCFSR